MAAATGIGYNGSAPGVFVTGYCTVDAASIAGGANEDITIAVPDAKVTDVAHVSPRTTLLNGLVISHAAVLAAGTITFTLENHTGGALNQASTVFNWALIRGSLGPTHVG